MAGQDWLRYANQGATRNRPLDPRLVQALGFLPELGLSAEVFSGGQPSAGEGGGRTGSVRHDHGGAGDVFFHQGDRRLDWANAQDRPLFEEVVRRGKANGITGFGAGPGYMQPGSMHIGFGNPGVWGAGGSGKTAPDWLVNAYNGSPAGKAPASLGDVVVAQNRQPASPPVGAPVAPSAPGVSPSGPSPAAFFGDVVAPAATPDFGSVVATYLQNRQRRDEDQQAEQIRRQALAAQIGTPFG